MNMLNFDTGALAQAEQRALEDRRNEPWTEAEKAKLIAERERKRPVPEIAEALGRPVGSCYAMARKLGTRVMPYTRWTAEMDAKLKAAVEEGVRTDAEIAADMDLSYSSIRYRIGELQLSRKRPVGETPKEPKPPKAERAPTARAAKAATKPKRPAWSDAELTALAGYAAAGDTTIEEAAEKLGRPVCGVRAKAEQIGAAFESAQVINARRADDRLKAIWCEAGNVRAAAKRLDRSATWVRGRAKALGLLSGEPMRNSAAIDGAERDRIGDLARRMTITEAARALRRDVRTLRKVAEELDIAFLKVERSAAKIGPRKPPKKKAVGASAAKVEPKAKRERQASPSAQRKSRAITAAPAIAAGHARPAVDRKGRLETIREVFARMKREGRLNA